MSGEQPRSDESSPSTDPNRRTFLRGASAAVATAAGLAGTASAQASEYDTITARGQTISVGPNETFENYLIDLTTGEDFQINVDGGNTVIRNVGFKGLYRGSGWKIAISSNATDTGDVLIENVYIGDGATKEGSDFDHGPGAIFYHRNANVDVTFRYCNVQGYPNNGFYCSNSAYGGTITWEHCFAKNNGVSSFRSGGSDDRIVDCVAYNDDTDYGPGYGGYVEENGRPVWARTPGPLTIEGGHFADGPYPYALVAGAHDGDSAIHFESGAFSGDVQRRGNSTVSIDPSVGTDPDLSAPDGVPTSAEAAARGASDGGSIVGDDDAHYFEIAGPGPFSLEVDETVEPDPEIAPYADYGDHYGDDWVSFELTETGETYWWFKDEIVDLEYTDDQTVWIDGEVYTGDGDAGVLEDFERTAPLADYGGAEQLFDVASSPVYEGSRALVNDGGDFGSIVSTTGLGEYPERGDEVSYYFTNAADDNFVGFHLFAQSETDNPDSYSVGISGYGAWRLWRHENGSIVELASDDLPAADQIDGWYRADVRTDETTVYADLYDASTDDLLASVRADDATYSAGGIGFRSAGNGEVWDYVRR